MNSPSEPTYIVRDHGDAVCVTQDAERAQEIAERYRVRYRRELGPAVVEGADDPVTIETVAPEQPTEVAREPIEVRGFVAWRTGRVWSNWHLEAADGERTVCGFHVGPQASRHGIDAPIRHVTECCQHCLTLYMRRAPAQPIALHVDA